MSKRTKKQIQKLIEKECYFCSEDDYDLLDVHRIIPGEDGGEYNDYNGLVVCCKCHRKCHSGRIEILGRHYSTSGRYVLHYIEDGIEKFK